MATPKQTRKYDFNFRAPRTSEPREIQYRKGCEVKTFIPRFPVDPNAAYDNPELVFSQIDKLPGSQRA